MLSITKVVYYDMIPKYISLIFKSRSISVDVASYDASKEFDKISHRTLFKKILIEVCHYI